MPVIQIASAVPLAPAGWGVGEALFGYLFSHFAYQGLPMASVNAAAAIEVMRTRAIALSIVYRVHIMLWSLLGALFLAFQKGRASSEEMSHLMDDLDDEGQGSAAEPERIRCYSPLVAQSLDRAGTSRAVAASAQEAPCRF